MKRRLLLAAAAAAAAAGVARIASADEERVIAVTARRFEFSPAVITVRRGEAVTLVFTAVDFMHGFSVPGLNLRADLLPGQLTRVHLKASRTGRFDFLCDNFCGDGHERMGGQLVVTE